MEILSKISNAVWGLPTAALIVSAGLLYTLSGGFPQIRRFKEILFSFRGEARQTEHLSPFQSLSTALAATVGTGSVTGVAAALSLGGPGAIFWLWVSAFFGMAVAYAEGSLSIKYRRTVSGKRVGGLWLALEDGLGAKKTARVYAAFCVLASFGMGSMAQTNSAALALKDGFSIPPAVFGVFAAAVLFLCLFSRIGFAARLCEASVPLLAGLYVAGAAAVIIFNAKRLPEALESIFLSAFGLKQAAAGTAGYAVKTAVSVGFRRGVFSNEAGLGTTAPVHAASSVESPDAQGLMNMLEVFIDTFVICTLTALAILCSGAYPSGENGAALVIKSAESVFGGVSGKLISLSLAGFATATAIGWSQIGLSAANYLCPGQNTLYKAAFLLSALGGTVMGLDAVWQISDIFNGLMAIPCLCAVILLFPEVRKSSKPPR